MADALRNDNTRKMSHLPHGVIDNLNLWDRERVTGTGANDQVHRLTQPVNMLHKVLVYSNTATTGDSEVGGGGGTGSYLRELAHQGTLSGQNGFTFADNKLTFGNSTTGFKPLSNHRLEIIYTKKRFYSTETTLTWSGTITTGDNKVPNTDSTVYIDGADGISCLVDTTATATTTLTLDFHAIMGHDTTTFAADTRPTIASGLAYDAVAHKYVTPGAKYLKVRMDVNTAGINSGNSVTCKVRPFWYLKG